jgi:hypothetical protein
VLKCCCGKNLHSRHSRRNGNGDYTGSGHANAQKRHIHLDASSSWQIRALLFGHEPNWNSSTRFECDRSSIDWSVDKRRRCWRPDADQHAGQSVPEHICPLHGRREPRNGNTQLTTYANVDACLQMALWRHWKRRAILDSYEGSYVDRGIRQRRISTQPRSRSKIFYLDRSNFS